MQQWGELSRAAPGSDEHQDSTQVTAEEEEEEEE